MAGVCKRTICDSKKYPATFERASWYSLISRLHIPIHTCYVSFGTHNIASSDTRSHTMCRHVTTLRTDNSTNDQQLVGTWNCYLLFLMMPITATYGSQVEWSSSCYDFVRRNCGPKCHTERCKLIVAGITSVAILLSNFSMCTHYSREHQAAIKTTVIHLSKRSSSTLVSFIYTHRAVGSIKFVFHWLSNSNWCVQHKNAMMYLVSKEAMLERT